MLDRIAVRTPHDGASAFVAGLVARVTGGSLLDLLQDATEVVGFRSLQRRELLVRHQVLLP